MSTHHTIMHENNQTEINKCAEKKNEDGID